MKRNRRGKYIFEEADLKFIRDNYKSMTNRELASALGTTLNVLRNRLYSLGLKRMEMEYWNPEQVEYLKKNFETIGDVEMAEIFQDRWPKNKLWTNKHIRKKRLYLNLHRTPEQSDAVRQRNIKMGRFADCAKKRWATIGVTPPGEIRLWKTHDRPVAVIKTKEGFVHYNRWLYISTFGPINTGQLVVTKSGKIIAEGPADLELISRSEHAWRNSLNRYPEELRDTVKLIRELNKELKNSPEDV